MKKDDAVGVVLAGVLGIFIAPVLAAAACVFLPLLWIGTLLGLADKKD